MSYMKAYWLAKNDAKITIHEVQEPWDNSPVYYIRVSFESKGVECGAEMAINLNSPASVGNAVDQCINLLEAKLQV